MVVKGRTRTYTFKGSAADGAAEVRVEAVAEVVGRVELNEADARRSEVDRGVVGFGLRPPGFTERPGVVLFIVDVGYFLIWGGKYRRGGGKSLNWVFKHKI